MTRQQKIKHLVRQGYKVSISIPTGHIIITTRERSYIFENVSQAHKYFFKY